MSLSAHDNSIIQNGVVANTTVYNIIKISKFLKTRV